MDKNQVRAEKDSLEEQLSLIKKTVKYLRKKPEDYISHRKASVAKYLKLVPKKETPVKKGNQTMWQMLSGIKKELDEDPEAFVRKELESVQQTESEIKNEIEEKDAWLQK